MERPSDERNRSVYTEGKSYFAGTKRACGAYAVYAPDSRLDTPPAIIAKYVRAERDMTSLDMQLRAAAEGVIMIRDSMGGRGVCYTTSPFITRALANWVPIWRRTGWRTKAGEPVKHRELIEALAGLQTESIGVKLVSAADRHQVHAATLADMAAHMGGRATSIVARPLAARTVFEDAEGALDEGPGPPAP